MASRFIPIEKLDKNIKYIIVGVPKCGTTSLGKYLMDRRYDVLERELQFMNIECAENHNYYDRTPIIVTRNPKERTISEINSWGSSLEKAKEYSYYKAGLQMWDYLVYSLEYLKTIEGFPHENITQKPELTLKIKK